MKKQTIFGLLAVMVVGLVATTGVVSAYRGDYSVEGPDYTNERHEAMESAFELNDYDGWYEMMTESGRHPRVVDVVTEENFVKFVEAHEAGNGEVSEKLRLELGLNNGNGPSDGTGHGQGMGQGTGQGQGQSGKGQGQGQKMQQDSFVDLDGDGNCDNLGSMQGKGRR